MHAFRQLRIKFYSKGQEYFSQSRKGRQDNLSDNLLFVLKPKKILTQGFLCALCGFARDAFWFRLARVRDVKRHNSIILPIGCVNFILQSGAVSKLYRSKPGRWGPINTIIAAIREVPAQGPSKRYQQHSRNSACASTRWFCYSL